MVVLAAVCQLIRSLRPLALFIVCGVSLAACGSTAVTSAEPSPVKCSLTLTNPDAVVSSTGGSGQVVLTTTPECAWTAAADTSAVTRIDPSSGQGSATLNVDLAPNPSASARMASIVVNGVRAQIPQAPAPCQFALSGSGAQSAAASGGTFQVTVSTTAGCGWAATSAASWVTITSGSPGSGTGVVGFTVEPNVGGGRDTTLTIAGQSFAVTQDAATGPAPPGPPPCTYAFNPPVLDVPATGAASLSVPLTTTCAWTATTNVPWITITSPAGSGSASIRFTAAVNTGTARSGTITVGSATVTINQAAPTACSFLLNPTTVNAPAGSTTGPISVASAASCSWTAISDSSWITITSGGAGSGNGTVGYSVATNAGTARSGTIRVGSATTTINQAAAAACSFGVNPTTFYVAVTAGSDSAAVTTPSSCSWTASSAASWITITSGAAGSGNGTVAFTWAANAGGSRIGTLTIAGQQVSVSQAERPPDCTATVNPLTFDIQAAGATNQMASVTAGTGCSWSASSNVPWISIASGASGSGPGSVRFNVAANSGAARNGTLTVAGRTVSVTQAAPCAYNVSPSKVSAPGAGGAGPAISVATGATCTWSATTSTPWLTIASGAAGTGNGTVTFNAGQNNGAPRTGSLSIAGQTVTVEQDTRCVYSVTVVPRSFQRAGGTAVATVVTAAGCPWTATSDSAWIVVPGGNHSGPGTVSITIQMNPANGNNRTGHVTVAGDTFEIQQSRNN